MAGAVRTHVLIDLFGYSAMVEDRGDAGILKILRPYERIVRAALPRPSTEVDHIGDAAEPVAAP